MSVLAPLSGDKRTSIASCSSPDLMSARPSAFPGKRPVPDLITSAFTASAREEHQGVDARLDGLMPSPPLCLRRAMDGHRFSEKDMRQRTNRKSYVFCSGKNDAAGPLLVIDQRFYHLRLLQEYKIDRESSREMTIDAPDDFPDREHCADFGNNVS
jgi:hypothetical protein